MKSYQTMRLELRRGFTLIELLVVISIIAILASLAMPAYNGIIRKARETDAKSVMSSIIMGIKSFEVEYNKLPQVTGATAGTDDADPFDTGEGNKIMPCLTAKDATLNPRYVSYFDPPPLKGTSGYDPTSMILNDPWGMPYHIAMDTNGDGVIKNPYAAGGATTEPATIAARVIVFSNGTNKIEGDNDDVRSWK